MYRTYRKNRTWVRSHERRIGLGRTTSVKGHIREFDTPGQVRRKHGRRSKMARATDEAIRAKQTKPFKSAKHRQRWQHDPAQRDIISVDS